MEVVPNIRKENETQSLSNVMTLRHTHMLYYYDKKVDQIGWSQAHVIDTIES